MTNAIMTTTSQFKDLNEFLAKHSAKNNEKGESSPFTHTRIGDKNLNIYLYHLFLKIVIIKIFIIKQ